MIFEMKNLIRLNAGQIMSFEEIERGEFAILVPVIFEEGVIKLLFETRALTLRRQPGEVCFPGGRIEEGESPADCALRECMEETGIPEEKIIITGTVGNMLSMLGETVNIIVGEIPDFDRNSLNINPSEVKEVFTVPLEYFLDLCPASSFTYEGHYIWGLTARAVNKLVKLLR